VSLPTEVSKLVKLHTLALSSNPKLNFGEAFTILSQLPTLEKLFLVGNRLEALPDSIGKLIGLKVLFLNENPLSAEERERIKKLLPHCEIKF
jgi:Leucine-rich repeat (LRR) protein